MAPVRKFTAILCILLLASWMVSPASMQTVISNNAADMANHIVMVADSTTPRTVTNTFTFSGAQTFTGLATFNRGGVLAPFAVGNAGAGTVTNLDADFLDAQTGTYYTNASNLASGTVPTARLGSGSATSSTFLRGDSSWASTSNAPLIISPTTTGTQNDYAPGISAVSGQTTIIRLNNASLLTINGLSGGVDGNRLTFISIGAGQVDFAHQNAGSTAANRLINFATSGLTSLAPGIGTAEFVYDNTTARWRLVNHDQGDFIDYGATSTITGWSSFTNQVIRYYLRGRSLQLVLFIGGTSNAATAQCTIPYTVSTGTYQGTNVRTVDNGTGGPDPGEYSAATSTISFFKDPSGTVFTASGSKQIIGSFVQPVS